jgi:hypothetical protein
MARRMELNEQVATRLKEWASEWPAEPSQAELHRALTFLAQWRSIVLSHYYLAKQGSVVYGGLFRGMKYLEQKSQGLLLPRLLGTYEAELQPYFEAFLGEGVDDIIDVGCAEGYYAVGLARLAPGVTVHAHDIDENARALCAELAQLNDVADRFVIGGEFKPADFQKFEGRRVLVLVDAEGAEVDVLDPAQAPALAGMAIVVETHDFVQPGAEATLMERFSETHEITRVMPRPKAFDVPPWMEGWHDVDLLIAGWEFRQRPTPWLVMRPRRPAGA